ncbi:MAG: hypothetical protein RDV48_24480 [Candidatus Eremiobacteraeota bacterium]|nr:hypothetical protein [Candidatus Eremiobacteraeota bacterium]
MKNKMKALLFDRDGTLVRAGSSMHGADLVLKHLGALREIPALFNR